MTDRGDDEMSAANIDALEKVGWEMSTEYGDPTSGCEHHKHSVTLGATGCPRCGRYIPDSHLAQRTVLRSPWQPSAAPDPVPSSALLP